MTKLFHSEKTQARTGRPFLLVIFSACALLVTGCGQYQAGIPTPPGSPAAAVSFCNNTESGCAPSGSFQVGGTRTVNVVIEWQNLTIGTHSQKVSFVLPSGDEYQAFEQSFEVAEGASGAVTTTQSLQVAGTWIAQRRLTGMWQVNFSLDGAPMGTQAVQLTQ
jgi:hypothetical protein